MAIIMDSELAPELENFFQDWLSSLSDEEFSKLLENSGLTKVENGNMSF